MQSTRLTAILQINTNRLAELSRSQSQNNNNLERTRASERQHNAEPDAAQAVQSYMYFQIFRVKILEKNYC